MSKYPQVEALFADMFADEIGQVGADTRKKIMEATGATDATVSRWISGDTRPRPAVWQGLANAAGVERQVVAAALSSDRVGADAVAVRLDHLSAKIDAAAEIIAENRDNLLKLLETLALLARERREDAEASRRTAAGE